MRSSDTSLHFLFNATLNKLYCHVMKNSITLLSVTNTLLFEKKELGLSEWLFHSMIGVMRKRRQARAAAEEGSLITL